VSDGSGFDAHDKKPEPARQPQPGELLFEFEHGLDRYRFERRAGAGERVEVQGFKNNEFAFGRVFQDRNAANKWASAERVAILKGGRDW
jgi:hypothetical protein